MSNQEIVLYRYSIVKEILKFLNKDETDLISFVNRKIRRMVWSYSLDNYYFLTLDVNEKDRLKIKNFHSITSSPKEIQETFPHLERLIIGDIPDNEMDISPLSSFHELTHLSVIAKISERIILPPKITHLRMHLSDHGIPLPDFPKGLKYLEILTKQNIDNLPDSIIYLDIVSLKGIKINKYPDSLKYLFIGRCNQDITNLPKGLISLGISECLCHFKVEVNEGLKYLMYFNLLDKYPKSLVYLVPPIGLRQERIDKIMNQVGEHLEIYDTNFVYDEYGDLTGYKGRLYSAQDTYMSLFNSPF